MYKKENFYKHKCITRAASFLLCLSMISSSFLMPHAEEEYVTLKQDYGAIDVVYDASASYSVNIPKSISLDAEKQSSYSIKATGDIADNQRVYVSPVDGIADTEELDFYMKDQTSGSRKADVVASITQNKFYWSAEEVADGYEETSNHISAPGLTAGKWKGTFQVEISLQTNEEEHTHNYTETIEKEPTCTEAGEKKYTCSCGDSYTEELPAKGHNYVDGTCEDCGEADPDHEHNYTETITKEPTCTKEGERTYTCECGDCYTEPIEAAGHDYVDGTCENCGEADPDHEHNYTETITKEPTCTEEGEKIYTCICGNSYIETIPRNHNYVDGVCTECGEADPDHTHSYTETITKQPTCTEAGEKKYTCSCGESYMGTIPATGHNFKDGACTECGEKDPNHTHSYTETITKEPTCTEDGKKTYTCICGDSYIDVIPATGHNYKETVIKEATCTEDGEKKYTCNCGNAYTESIPATGHDYVDGTCSNCNRVKEYTLEFSDVYIGSNSIQPLTGSTEIEFDSYKLDDGDKVHLPKVSDGCYAVNGWYYAKEENAKMRNDDGKVHESLISVRSWGPVKDSVTGEMTDENWKQSATSGDLVITEPSMLVMSITVDVGLATSCPYTASASLVDVDNNKTYSLFALANAATASRYDYGNISIVASRETGTSRWNTSYAKSKTLYKYVVYLEPGTYRVNASASIGNGKSYTPNSALALGMHSADSTGSYFKLYSLHDLAEGMTFDASEMYTSKVYNAETGEYDIYRHISCIPKMDIQRHFDQEQVYTSPSCLYDGTKKLWCSKCGIINYEPIPATGHNYVPVTKEPTCTAAGSKTYTCANCSDSYSETLEALGHNYVNGKCTRCGNINYITTSVMSWVSDKKYSTTSSKYGNEFTIDKNMADGEYLAVTCYLYNSTSTWTMSKYNGVVTVQKYNETTGSWSNVSTKSIANTTSTTNYTVTGLEKGKYRMYASFTNSSTTNYYQMGVYATTYIFG